MRTETLEVKVDVPDGLVKCAHIERTLELEFCWETLEPQVDSFLASLNAELRKKLMDTAGSKWLYNSLTGELD